MTDRKINDGDAALARIRAAMSGVHGARLEVVPLLLSGKGSAVQVYEVTATESGRFRHKKCGPLIVPGDGQTVADVLHMLGDMTSEATR